MKKHKARISLLERQVNDMASILNGLVGYDLVSGSWATPPFDRLRTVARPEIEVFDHDQPEHTPVVDTEFNEVLANEAIDKVVVQKTCLMCGGTGTYGIGGYKGAQTDRQCHGCGGTGKTRS